MEIHEGQIIEGEITRIMDEAVFVDIGENRKVVVPKKDIDRLSQSQVDDIREGVTIPVYLYHVPHNGGNPLGSISKATGNGSEDQQAPSHPAEPQPWDKVQSQYQVGDIVEGTVTNIRRYGAFVRLPSGIEGLVHVSEMEPGYTPSPFEVVSPGETVTVRIINIEPHRKRIGLSLNLT